MSRVRLAVLGDPLAYTRSPDLHRAGLAAVGLEAESVALPTAIETLPERLRGLAATGYTGVNLTHPLKESVIALLARVSPAAREARSVNTVGFAAEGWWGETTDGPGFLDLIRTWGRDPAQERVVLLGGGAAARSLAASLLTAGAAVVVSVRRLDAAREVWRDLPRATLTAWRGAEESDGLARATLVVNATPGSSASEPIAPAALPAGGRAVDLTYGPQTTGWVRACRARGLEAEDGLGLLVHQARRSLSLWTGRDVPLEPLARAVGWPR